jgi:hypothetical protein
MSNDSREAKPRFLVEHQSGMTTFWWWVRAASPRHIETALAGVQVVTDEDTLRWAEGMPFERLDLDSLPKGHHLDELRAERDGQHRHARYGALLGKDRVYLRFPSEDEDDPTFLTEFDSRGQVLRQVEQWLDGQRLGVRARTCRRTPGPWTSMRVSGPHWRSARQSSRRLGRAPPQRPRTAARRRP